MQTKQLDDQLIELEQIIRRAAELMDEIGSVHIGIHDDNRSIILAIEANDDADDDDDDEIIYDA